MKAETFPYLKGRLYVSQWVGKEEVKVTYWSLNNGSYLRNDLVLHLLRLNNGW